MQTSKQAPGSEESNSRQRTAEWRAIRQARGKTKGADRTGSDSKTTRHFNASTRPPQAAPGRPSQTGLNSVCRRQLRRSATLVNCNTARRMTHRKRLGAIGERPVPSLRKTAGTLHRESRTGRWTKLACGAKVEPPACARAWGESSSGHDTTLGLPRLSSGYASSPACRRGFDCRG